MVCANRESRGIMHWQLVTDDYGHIIQPRQRKVPQKIHLPNDQIDFYRAIKLIFKASRVYASEFTVLILLNDLIFGYLIVSTFW